MPYHIIPGNHDTKWSESGGTQFINIWKSDRFVFYADKYVFIGLHQGPIMRMSEGHFAPEDIRWLDSVLNNIDNNKSVIFVSHYPLDQSITNWYEVIDLLKKKNTELILCGHGHANNSFSFEGIPGVMGRSDLRTKEKPGGYNIVEIKNDSVYFFERTHSESTKNLWYKIKLSQVDYSKDTTKYLRPDFSINKKYPGVKIKWSSKENFLITSAVGFLKDKIFVGNSGGEITAYNSTNGKLLWKYFTSGKIFSSPAFYNNMVLFGCSDSNLYCLNATDGKLKWKYKTEGPILCSPVVEKNIIYFSAGDYSFKAVDLTSKELIWNFTGLNGFVETKPLLTKNKIIFGAWDSYLYALDKTTGEFKWKWNNGRIEELYSPAACEPVTSNGKIFIVAPDRFLTAINEETGEIIWRSNKHQVRESIGISADGKTIFSRTMNDSVFAFSPSENQLKEKWIVAANYGYDFNPGSIVELKGKIFFGTKNGLIYCLNSKNGKILWIHKIGVSSVNKISVANSNNIIASDMDGKIVSLKF
jgi:outer membrane protein assembly factor BamB/calcineurin-like phosphoesterase family protein